MPTVSLPDHASLETMRREARLLQAGVLAGRPAALAQIDRHAPGLLTGPSAPLHLAQLVVARSHGFSSWPSLKHYFDLAAGLRFDGGPAPEDETDTDRFCRLATLDYSGDDPDRWIEARRLLDARPSLVEESVWAAAGAAQPAAVRIHLERDPSLATRRGGPHGWSPLYYLAYSRLDPAASSADVTSTATMLLAAGADPNEGYLWGGQPLPFTLVTGAFGDGELGPDRQPHHPHALLLARLFLAAGADPNDGQTLYNRMFRPIDDHLVLLLEYGLGRGGGGPWRALLGDLMDTPAAMVRGQLSWAIDHGFVGRVRLLVAHGVDLTVPLTSGHRPAAAAVLAGRPDIAALLLAAGAPPVELDPVDRLIGAALVGDRAAVDAMVATSAVSLPEARRRRPGLVVWATAVPSAAGIRLLVDLGFDVNALGRSDTPIEQSWETALHHAAGEGDAAMVELLMDLGADPTVRDRRFGSTPAEWAGHFGHHAVVRLLADLTRRREP